MKKIFISLFIINCVCLITSCSRNKQHTASPSNATQDSSKVRFNYTSELPEMSVYNLTSQWTTQNNETIQLKSLRGKIIVVVMIYTSCSSACPILVEKTRTIYSKLNKKEKNKVRFVFVSIDPKTDTPERLKSFAQKKKMDSKHFVFLRSSIENTRTLSTVLGVNYKEVSNMDYKHSNIISVLDKNGEIIYQQKGLGVNVQQVMKTIRNIK